MAGNQHDWNASKAEVEDERGESGDGSQIVKGLLSHCLAFAFPVRDVGNQCRGESSGGGWGRKLLSAVELQKLHLISFFCNPSKTKVSALSL